jgi:hypothetical protein
MRVPTLLLFAAMVGVSVPSPVQAGADRIRGFERIEDARAFALANIPAVVCERWIDDDGRSELREIFRHDLLYDQQREEWRVMLG